MAEAAQSYTKALDYLRRYPDPKDGSLLYTLTFQGPDE